MFTEGALLLERVAPSVPERSPGRRTVARRRRQGAARHRAARSTARLAAAASPRGRRACSRAHPLRDLVTAEGPYPLFVDRRARAVRLLVRVLPALRGRLRRREDRQRSSAARFAHRRRSGSTPSPRWASTSSTCRRSTRSARSTARARNNTLTPGPDDPGSPWAIGSAEGGHDAIHPDLGTIEDFDAFVARARELGLEVALDFALQASPDHPWVTEHPEWFTTRADGTIAYAENPPKKYQDIYPINFDNDPEGIYAEVLRVVRLLDGPRRADLPRRQPAHQAGGVLGVAARRGPPHRPRRALPGRGVHPAGDDARARHGRLPPVLHLLHLAQRRSGSSRSTSRELSQRDRPPACGRTSSSTPPTSCTRYLQYGGPPAFKIRAVARRDRCRRRWGVYAGYELFEHVAVRPGSEEYLDSEKYQLRLRDWDAAEREGRTLAPYLTRLNEIRRAHPALQQLRNLHVPPHATTTRCIVLLSKRGRATTPSSWSSTSTRTRTRETTVHLDMPALGLDWHEHVRRCTTRSPARPGRWGEHNYVRLDPFVEPAHILTVRRHRDRSDPADATTPRRPSRTARRAPRARLVQDAPSSTRCWSARSTTATATASATSRA